MAAKVGLLSRNIRIQGESYDDVMQESFGARVLASSYYEEDTNVKRTGMEDTARAFFTFCLTNDASANTLRDRYSAAILKAFQISL